MLATSGILAGSATASNSFLRNLLQTQSGLSYSALTFMPTDTSIARRADPQAGRYPGGYPPWPAGARRRAIVGVASAWPHQERRCSPADQSL